MEVEEEHEEEEKEEEPGEGIVGSKSFDILTLRTKRQKKQCFEDNKNMEKSEKKI